MFREFLDLILPQFYRTLHMKWARILLALIILFKGINANATDMKIIREWYYKAVHNHTETVALMAQLNKEPNTPTLNGYRAATNFLLADQSGNIFSKWKYFKSGKNMLEAALKQEPTNMELRFIRFTIQTNIPSYLGYHGQIDFDKNYLLDCVKANKIKEPELKAGFLSVFENSKKLTEEEKKICKQHLK